MKDAFVLCGTARPPTVSPRRRRPKPAADSDIILCFLKKQHVQLHVRASLFVLTGLDASFDCVRVCLWEQGVSISLPWCWLIGERQGGCIYEESMTFSITDTPPY